MNWFGGQLTGSDETIHAEIRGRLRAEGKELPIPENGRRCQACRQSATAP